MAFADRFQSGEWRVEVDPEWRTYVPAGEDGGVMTVAARDRYHAKQGRSVVRWSVPGGPRPLVVYLKRHAAAPRWLRWLALAGAGWGRSAALVEWAHLRWARAEGFPVPRPWAAGECAGPGAAFQSFLAVEELAAMLPLNEAVPLAQGALPPSAYGRWKRGVVAEVARLSARLHGLRRFHKDLYLCHFYLPAADCRHVPPTFVGRLWMIDFHRLGHHPLTAGWWRAKDLAQLLYSTVGVEGVTARDRLRFWRLYAGAERRRWAGRLVRWAVGVRGRNYARHEANRRAAA